MTQHVLRCTTCQRCKHEQEPYPGLLQPLKIPSQVWEQITMDFIEGMPKFEGFDTILVVVDRVTKFGHFIALAHPFTATEVARKLMDHVFKLHGVPRAIISDWDKIFTSQFWKTLLHDLGIGLWLSLAYHPKTDGQTERVSPCLETYLKCLCFTRPWSWNRWIALAQWWYNTNCHTAHKRTPFEALFGYSPPIISAIMHYSPAETTTD